MKASKTFGSPLVQDNKVFLEFHNDYCLVKETHTGKVMLEGELSDGLYKLGTMRATGSTTGLVDSNLKSNTEIMACSTVVRSIINLTVSKNILHRRLGHPSLKILNDVVRKCKLPVNVNEEFNFYEA